MAKVVTLFVYSFFYAAIFALISPALCLTSKGRRWFFGRFRRRAFPSEGAVWFHVSSSGELEQAIPIMESVRKSQSTFPIGLTYFSPSAEKAVALEVRRRQKWNKTIPWDSAFYAPFDTYCGTRRFVRKLKPSALILLHRELWPNLIHAALLESVPVYWVNVALPKKQTKFLSWFSFLVEKFTWVGATDRASSDRIQEVFPLKSVEAVGDARIDRIIERKKLATPGSPQNKATLILASLWEEDWRAIEGAVLEGLQKYPELQVRIFPHDTTSKVVQEVKASLDLIAIPLEIYSETPQKRTSCRVEIFNFIGALAESYADASWVFVGGSFKSRVHNVLEPAVYRLPILTGPFIQNSVEAMFLSESKAILSGSAEAFRSNLGKLLSGELPVEPFQNKLEAYFSLHEGASRRYAEGVLKTLKK